MGKKRCCCGDCLVHGDTFDRPDSTDVGGGWTEVTGNWEILDNEATGTGLLLSNHAQAGCTAVVYVKLRHLRAGYSWRVIVAYQDEDNYLFSQFTATDDYGGHTISLNSRSGGVETGIKSATSAGYNEQDVWRTCYSPEVEFSTGLPQSDLWVTECQSGSCAPGIQGVSVGLSIPAQPNEGNRLAFDDFEYYRHNTEDHRCPFCDCHCQEPGEKAVCLPETLHLTVHNIVGCSGYDGWDVTLTQSYTAKTIWESALAGVKRCESGWPWWFKLTCLGGAYELQIDLKGGGWLQDPGNGTFVDNAKYRWTLSPGDSGYRCTPLHLTFPPFDLLVVSDCAEQFCCADPSCGEGYTRPSLYPDITL